MSNTNLRSKFTLWILDDQKTTQQQSSQSFEQKLKPVSTFDNLKDFWQLFQFVNKPSKMKVDIYMFIQGVKPLWQDPQNERGGYYSLKLEKTKCDKIWESAVFALISPIKDVATCLNGVRIKIKEEFVNLQIWMNEKASESNLEVRQYMKDSLQIMEDRVFVFFSFSRMINGIKGKDEGATQKDWKDRPKQNANQTGFRQKGGR